MWDAAVCGEHSRPDGLLHRAGGAERLRCGEEQRHRGQQCALPLHVQVHPPTDGRVPGQGHGVPQEPHVSHSHTTNSASPSVN